MKGEKYNGWANWDTWNLNLWLDNERRNYDFCRRNKSKLLKMNKVNLLLALKRNCIFKDKFDWSKINITETKANIREM